MGVRVKRPGPPAELRNPMTEDTEHLLFDFVDDGMCVSCKKELAEVGGLCISCDHLQDDINLDKGRNDE